MDCFKHFIFGFELVVAFPGIWKKWQGREIVAGKHKISNR